MGHTTWGLHRAYDCLWVPRITPIHQYVRTNAFASSEHRTNNTQEDSPTPAALPQAASTTAGLTHLSGTQPSVYTAVDAKFVYLCGKDTSYNT